jgi:hypothetical protein
MKLLREQFESFAFEQGYDSGEELFEQIGLSANTYKYYCHGGNIGKRTLKRLCQCLGSYDVMQFVEYDKNDTFSYNEIFDEF